MLAKLKTFSLLGIHAVPVEVEVDVSPAGLPKTLLVGLPEVAVKESTHRVERAMINSGFQCPQNRAAINLVARGGTCCYAWKSLPTGRLKSGRRSPPLSVSESLRTTISLRLR